MEKIRKFFGFNDNLEFFAWTLAFTAIGMFLVPVVVAIFNIKEYDFTQYAIFVGGTAGPLAALAGFIFIYKTLRYQQVQIEKHDEQFRQESFENTFFKLIDFFDKQSEKNFSEGYGDVPLLEKLEKFYVLMRKHNEMYDWDRYNPEYRSKLIGEKFDYCLSQGFARVRSIEASNIGILKHLNSYRQYIDHEYFLSVLYNNLNVHEERIIFYGFFSRKIELDSYEKDLLIEYLKIFNSKHSLHKRDKELIIV